MLYKNFIKSHTIYTDGGTGIFATTLILTKYVILNINNAASLLILLTCTTDTIQTRVKN